MPQYYPTDAGQLLFGPLGDFLREYSAGQQARGAETRARAERQSARDEMKGRYDEQMAQGTAELRIKMLQQATPQTAPAYMEELQRQGAPAYQGGGGTIRPTPTMVEAQGPGAPMLQFPPGGEAGPPQQVEDPLPRWEPGVAPPTHPDYQAVLARQAQEQQAVEQQRSAALRDLMANITSRAGAPETSLDILGHKAERTPVEMQRDIPGHKASLRTELGARDAAKERQAAARSRGAGAGRRPERATQGEVARTFKNNDFAGYTTLVRRGMVREVDADTPTKDVRGLFDAGRGQFKQERAAKAEVSRINKEIQGSDREIASLERKLAQHAYAYDKTGKREIVEAKIASLQSSRDAAEQRLSELTGVLEPEGQGQEPAQEAVDKRLLGGLKTLIRSGDEPRIRASIQQALNNPALSESEAALLRDLLAEPTLEGLTEMLNIMLGVHGFED